MALQERRVWDKERFVDAAESHRTTALEGGFKGVSAANGALELIGRSLGYLSNDHRDNAPVRVTRIEVRVPSRGADVVIDSREVQYLEPGDEMDPEADDAK